MADTTPGPAGRRVVRGDLTVTKTPDPGADPAPEVTLRVSSEYDVPVAVRIVEPVPDDADPERVCVPAADTDHWALADDGLAWSGHVPPGGEAEAVYGVLPADADRARTVLGAPVVDAVHPAADTADGGPQWRTADATAVERTTADVAAEESPAALAAAEATVRAAMDAGATPAHDAGEDSTPETGHRPDAADADPTEATGVGHDADSDVRRDAGRRDADRDDAGAESAGADSDDAADFDATDATGTHLRVEFADDATTTARERALRSFARTADVTGCEPGIGRVASERADEVRLRVASGAVADALADHDAVRRVVDVTPDRCSPEDTFRELKREHDAVPPAELQRALDEATADGATDGETVGLGELLAEYGEDEGQTGMAGSGAPDAVNPDASGATDASDTDASGDYDTAASNPDASGGRDTAAPTPGGDGNPLVDALVAALADAPDDQVAALRTALSVPERGRDRERLTALQTRVERVEDAVDDLGSDAGASTDARALVADLHERTATLASAVDSLTDEAGEARLDRSVLESDLGELTRAVEDLRERVVAVERTGADRLYGDRRAD